MMIVTYDGNGEIPFSLGFVLTSEDIEKGIYVVAASFLGRSANDHDHPPGK
jgi:hypothetical protein